MSDDDRVELTLEQAEKMIPVGDKIHVFSNPGVGMLVGADWDRENIIELFKGHRRLSLAQERQK